MNKRLGYTLVAIVVTLLLINHPPTTSYATGSYQKPNPPSNELSTENLMLLRSVKDLSISLDSINLENNTKLVELETQQTDLKWD